MKYRWKDINLYTGRIVEGEEALLNACVNICKIGKGDILLKPYIGSELEDYLFEIEDDIFKQDVLALLSENISKFDPRIRIIRGLSDVKLDPDNRLAYINLVIEEMVSGEKFNLAFNIEID